MSDQSADLRLALDVLVGADGTQTLLDDAAAQRFEAKFCTATGDRIDDAANRRHQSIACST